MANLKLKMSLDDIGERIGIDPRSWDGNCHAVAKLLVAAGIVVGRVAYGHYRGRIANTTRWARYPSVGFVRHGWIITEDDFIVDPVRWSFEGKQPYIYCSKPRKSKACKEYDEGGNVLRAALMKPCPSSRKKPSRRVKTRWRIPSTADFVAEMVKTKTPYYITEAQVFWLANLPLSLLGDFACDVYETLGREGHKAYVPIDNWRAVMED